MIGPAANWLSSLPINNSPIFYTIFIYLFIYLSIFLIADCHFGKKVYELEERWNPDLGSPFGVMYCIRCECIAVSFYYFFLFFLFCFCLCLSSITLFLVNRLTRPTCTTLPFRHIYTRRPLFINSSTRDDRVCPSVLCLNNSTHKRERK
jgi:hypothetical protein